MIIDWQINLTREPYKLRNINDMHCFFFWDRPSYQFGTQFCMSSDLPFRSKSPAKDGQDTRHRWSAKRNWQLQGREAIPAIQPSVHLGVSLSNHFSTTGYFLVEFSLPTIWPKDSFSLKGRNKKADMAFLDNADIGECSGWFGHTSCCSCPCSCCSCCSCPCSCSCSCPCPCPCSCCCRCRCRCCCCCSFLPSLYLYGSQTGSTDCQVTSCFNR